jgi:hypothetical protein
MSSRAVAGVCPPLPRRPPGAPLPDEPFVL